MNNNGYTKIPNAIIRLATISPSERLAWCLIASLPQGYALSTNAACAMLGINSKTWRQCIAVLKQRGMITVENIPGHANVYSVTGAENWDTTPAKNWYTQKTAGAPKNGTPPMPKNGMGTHTNNKEQLKTIEEEDARVRVIANLKTYDYWAENMCKNYHLTHEQLCAKVDEFVINMACHDTKIEELQNARAYFNAWLSNKFNRNNGNNQQTGQPGDIRAKLDADAAKAMATLASRIGKPDIVPF